MKINYYEEKILTNADDKEITLSDLLAFFCADVEIFLLKDESQDKYLDKLFSKEEILEQLENTLHKVYSLPVHPKVWETPLFSNLTKVVLKEEGFSNQEIQKAKKNSYEA